MLERVSLWTLSFKEYVALDRRGSGASRPAGFGDRHGGGAADQQNAVGNERSATMRKPAGSPQGNYLFWSERAKGRSYL